MFDLIAGLSSNFGDAFTALFGGVTGVFDGLSSLFTGA